MLKKADGWHDVSLKRGDNLKISQDVNDKREANKRCLWLVACQKPHPDGY
jgi:hypothetical protein